MNAKTEGDFSKPEDIPEIGGLTDKSGQKVLTKDDRMKKNPEKNPNGYQQTNRLEQ